MRSVTVLALALFLGAGVLLAAPAGGFHGRSDGLAVSDTVKVAGTPIAVAAGFNAVWVTDNDDGTVVRINPTSNKVVATIRVGDYPNAIAAGLGAIWVEAQTPAIRSSG
jgi:YVTN family beta-propeller protein